VIRYLTCVLVVFSFLAAPQPAPAQSGKQIERLLKRKVERVIRKTIKKQVRRKPVRKQEQSSQRVVRKQTATPAAPKPVNPQNRRIQTALNYFGFDAGVADGVLGPRSRAAISGYQGFLGLAATGTLTDVGREHLVSAYDRAVADPTAAAHVIASSPHGVKGLLVAYRDEPGTAVPETRQVDAYQTNAPATVPVGQAPVQTGETLTQYCREVDAASVAGGGYVSVDDIDDPWRALGEQFCLARDDAIFAGDDLKASVQGLSEDEIDAHCRSFGPLLAPYVAAVSLEPREEVVDQVRDYAVTTGMPPDQLVLTSQICLSVGYRVDDLEVAIGSALVLAAMGDPLYSELLGHHLILGIGAEQNGPRALGWYDPALLALDAGAEPVFDPFNPDRVALIRKASAMVATPQVVTR